MATVGFSVVDQGPRPTVRMINMDSGMPGGIITSAAAYSAEAQQFFTRLSSQPTSARKTLYAAMIDSLVSTGVWAKLDALYAFAAADSATALTNLKQNSYAATELNTPTFTADSGYAGGTTKSVSSNFNPSTATSPNYVRNSASHFAWSLTATALAGATLGANTGGAGFSIFPRWTDNIWYADLNNGTAPAVQSGVTDGSGLRTHTRTVSTGFDGYSAGSFVATVTAASVAVANDTLIFLNSAGSADPYTGTVALGGFGGGLTAQNISDLYAAGHPYLQAVAGVP